MSIESDILAISTVSDVQQEQEEVYFGGLPYLGSCPAISPNSSGPKLQDDDEESPEEQERRLFSSPWDTAFEE